MRARILDAAAEAYARHGYSDTSVQHVLDAAGVSRPTFYRFFAGKAEVLDAVVARANARLVSMVQARTAGEGDAAVRLVAAIDAYLAWGAEVGPLGRVLYGELEHPESPVPRYRRATLRAILSLFARQMREAGRDDVDPLVFEALVAVVERTGSSLFRKGTQRAGAVARARAVTLRIVLASLAAPAEMAAVPPLPRRGGAPARRR